MTTGIAVTRSAVVVMRSECEIWENGRENWSGRLGRRLADHACAAKQQPWHLRRLPHERRSTEFGTENAGQPQDETTRHRRRYSASQTPLFGSKSIRELDAA